MHHCHGFISATNQAPTKPLAHSPTCKIRERLNGPEKSSWNMPLNGEAFMKYGGLWPAQQQSRADTEKELWGLKCFFKLCSNVSTMKLQSTLSWEVNSLLLTISRYFFYVSSSLALFCIICLNCPHNKCMLNRKWNFIIIYSFEAFPKESIRKKRITELRLKSYSSSIIYFQSYFYFKAISSLHSSKYFFCAVIWVKSHG